jgi:hypothetical protein
LRGNVSNLYIKADLKGGRIFLFCGLLLFALTAFVGADFFHYYEFMSEYRGQVFGDQELGLESFYQYLINYIDGNYFLFRLVVWGGSLMIIKYAIRLFGANLYHTLFLILAGFIITFSYARATLAIAVLSLGVVFVCIASDEKIRKKAIYTIVGFAIMSCSIYFHRSMLPMFVLATGWIILPWKKQLTKYSLWLFPILVVVCSTVLKIAFEELFVAANTIVDETGTLHRAEYYIEQESVASNINGYIRLVFHYAVFYLPMIILSNAVRSDEVLQKAGGRGIWLYQINYLILIFATSFVFLDFDSNVLFDRYLYMLFIPLSILIAYLKDSGALAIKQYYSIVACFILCNLFQLFAYVYKVYE